MKHVWNTIITTVIATLIVGSAADSNARPRDFNKAFTNDSAGKGAFTVTARYMGSLEGQIYVAGRQVYVPRNTPIFVVGKGIQDKGYFVNDQFVYVSGTKKRGAVVATMIVVRPDGDDARRGPHDQRSAVGESADNVPE